MNFKNRKENHHGYAAHEHQDVPQDQGGERYDGYTGAVKYATRTYSSINPEISDDDLLAIGQGLGALQTHDVGDVQRVENATMITG